MNRSSRSSSSAGVSTPAAILTVAALAVAIALAFVAGGNRGAAAPSPAPSTPVVTPAPSAPGSPVISPAPSEPAASDDPSAGPDGAEVPLDVFLDHKVVLGISDREGLLAGAKSGTARDGMSVRWGTANVRNLDDRTIEVTWAGYPQDELITLVVKRDGNGVLLRFGQNLPYPNTDAMGADRVVVLTFEAPVSAAQVVTDFTTADD